MYLQNLQLYLQITGLKGRSIVISFAVILDPLLHLYLTFPAAIYMSAMPLPYSMAFSL